MRSFELQATLSGLSASDIKTDRQGDEPMFMRPIFLAVGDTEIPLAEVEHDGARIILRGETS